MDDDDLSDILTGIAHNLQLQRLAIDFNKCHQKIVRALSSFLEQQGCSLVEIDVSHQEGGLGSKFVSSLLSSLHKKPRLKELKMSNNRLRDEHLSLISETLRGNSALINVDLRFNCFTCNGIKQIVAATLPLYRTLRRLQLRTGSSVLRKDLLDTLVLGMQNNWNLLYMDLFEWDRRLQHCFELNRSNRLILRDCDFSHVCGLCFWSGLYRSRSISPSCISARKSFKQMSKDDKLAYYSTFFEIHRRFCGNNEGGIFG